MFYVCCDLQVISRFPLTHEEIVARRMLLSSTVDRGSRHDVSAHTPATDCQFSVAVTHWTLST